MSLQTLASEHQKRSEVCYNKYNSKYDRDNEKHLLESSAGVQCSAASISSAECPSEFSTGALKKNKPDQSDRDNDKYPRQSVPE